MNSVEELPSSEVEFVDEALESAFDELGDDERLSVLVRPVGHRQEFIDAVEADSFGANCEAIATESVSIDVSENEYDVLVSEGLVEAVEAVRPL